LNLFYTQHFRDKQECEQTTTAHILVYILRGNIRTKNEPTQIYPSGEWIFIPKGNTLYFQPEKNKDFTAFILTFTPHFLNNLSISPFSGLGSKPQNLTKTPDTESLYYSLLPYYYYEKEPCKEIMNLKLQTAIFCLLQNNPAPATADLQSVPF